MYSKKSECLKIQFLALFYNYWSSRNTLMVYKENNIGNTLKCNINKHNIVFRSQFKMSCAFGSLLVEQILGGH